VIRTASPHDLPALRALFARANDAPYDLAAVAEEKCFGLGVAGPPYVRVYGDMQGAVVTCGRYVRILVVDREARRRGIATALLADAEARGASVIAAEAGNYFTPGVVDSDVASTAFFQSRGYIETRFTYNLEVGTPASSPAGRAASSPPWSAGEDACGPAGGTPAFRRPTHNESDRVLAFVEREFGRIWRFEAAKAFETQIPNVFIAEEDREVTGFAVHDVNNRGLGFFGPTGVVTAMRGRGIGCLLLHASLADLRRIGYDRAVIPWTDALAFYRKCSGAEPAHRFVAFAKSQP
jgi:GNAT superfamily N-acetyltransferase/N-acetylglutamate synthase-like GNAT family acetyltransferase